MSVNLLIKGDFKALDSRLIKRQKSWTCTKKNYLKSSLTHKVAAHRAKVAAFIVTVKRITVKKFFSPFPHPL